ncbi:MAG TPA: FHA domain-containing protein [Thiolinea sp.]|nr:FHA domain-containing protein [Thiolinea sp.]
MAQLIVHLNNQIVQRIRLSKPSYSIGRNNHCDIVLPERTVSSRHARLINAGEDCFLEDDGSTNGVYVNNVKGQKHMLIDNDIIAIGKYRLVFRNDVGLLTQIRQLSVHPRLMDNAGTPRLEILSGRKKGHVIPLDKKPRVVLGGQGISRLTIERNQKGEYLMHSKSLSGVDQVDKLANEQVFRIEEVELMFRNN